jgi:RNA polymerase sigma-70 factor, ECF subfamily
VGRAHPRRPHRHDRGAAGDGLPGGRERRRRGSGGRAVVATSQAVVDRLFRHESGRAVATLIRILGDFDLAEDAVQEAFAIALERWPTDGLPDNPGAWITRTARNRAIDRLRRDRRYKEKLRELDALGREETVDVSAVPDDRLRLFFTCCHPALAPEARVALTLRTLGGLSTPEVARAFLVGEATMAQRLVRAKRKISVARIPYVVPEDHDLPDRLGSVLSALYLVFNEGYLATSADALVRRELCDEAIRLGRVLVELMPDEAEARGLLALMLLHNSRRLARVDEDGRLVLLEDQDRSLWDRGQIAEGLELTERAGLRGPYGVQAAIAAEHARAALPGDTRWDLIAALYGRLAAMQPSPVVELNRAAAVAMAEGPARGLELMDRLAAEGDLDRYHLLHSARADLLRRLGRAEEAGSAYRAALELTSNPVERSFLERRLAELGGS